MTLAVVAFALVLAAANGSNDDPKGVATLGGTGVARYRQALVWGVVATLAGSLASAHFASGLTKLFSSGIVTALPTPAFALAVLLGASAWVALATLTRLPVSTTHALVGALVGAGLVLGPHAIAWDTLVPRIVEPLLISVVIAYVGSVVINLIPGRVPECICADLGEPVAVTIGERSAALAFSGAPTRPVVHTGTVAECRAHQTAGRSIAVTVNGLHWLTAGAASFARGLNDTPKIVAIAAFTAAPSHARPTTLAVSVALAMAAGGLVGGTRVARRLGDDVIAMEHVEGAKANLVSATLVGLGATHGLPISLTHVSTGAIAGTAGCRASRLNRRTLRDFALAWTVTPLIAGTVAAAAFAGIR